MVGVIFLGSSSLVGVPIDWAGDGGGFGGMDPSGFLSLDFAFWFNLREFSSSTNFLWVFNLLDWFFSFPFSFKSFIIFRFIPCGEVHGGVNGDDSSFDVTWEVSEAVVVLTIVPFSSFFVYLAVMEVFVSFWVPSRGVATVVEIISLVW